MKCEYIEWLKFRLGIIQIWNCVKTWDNGKADTYETKVKFNTKGFVNWLDDSNKCKLTDTPIDNDDYTIARSNEWDDGKTYYKVKLNAIYELFKIQSEPFEFVHFLGTFVALSSFITIIYLIWS